MPTNSKLPFVRALVVLAALLPWSSSFAENLMVNGDFEGGWYGHVVPVGWTGTGGWEAGSCSTGWVYGAGATCAPRSGNWATTFGYPGPSQAGWLSQTVATDTGGEYSLSFFLSNAVGTSAEGFDVFWGGVKVYSEGGGLGYSFKEVVLDVFATSNSSVLTFVAWHGPSQWFMDDVSLNRIHAPVVAVPEPPMFGLLFAGLLGLMASRRRG